MKASAAIQITALAACFAAHFAFAGEFNGVRRALQTMTAAQAQAIALPVQAVAPKSWQG